MTDQQVADEESKVVSDKETAIARSKILQKARDAKKRKKEDSDSQMEFYAHNLENIHANLRNLNTQMSTLVNVVSNPPSKKIKKEAIPELENPPKPVPQTAPVTIAEEDKTSDGKYFLNSKTSYLLGEALAAGLVGVGMCAFKLYRRNDINSQIKSRYSNLV